jgi:hypothetical protein
MILKNFTQDELDALYDSIVYLMQCEQSHYEECLCEGDEDIINSHIYLKALDAFNALNREAHHA